VARAFAAALVNLLFRRCARAIRTGAEALTESLLEQVEIDETPETARKQTARLLRHCSAA
jgi:hypothetical protein